MTDGTSDGEALLDLYERHGNPGLARVFRFMGLTAVEATGTGAVLVAEDGAEYLDLAGGYGVFFHGYRHPRLMAVAEAQLGRLPLSSRVLVSRPPVELAALLARVTPGDLTYSFFVNSGAEAVEAALKLARAATGRPRLVATIGGFHGKTLGALSVSGRALYRDPFEPLLADVVHVPYGDLDALAALVDERTAAVIVEPIQGEGGVVVPPDGYLAGVRGVCDAAGALFIADEVQTGMGRTGALWAVEHEGVVPDLLCAAKALGGGIMPIGAVVGRPVAFRVFESAPLIHTSTFGGNPLATAVAAEAIRVALDEQFPEQARIKGARLRAGLEAYRAAYPDLITDVRGRGLMLGMEVAHAGVAGAIMAELFRRHVLAVHTLNNERVIRLLPPAVIAPEQIDDALDRLGAALAAVRALHLEEES